MFEFIQSLALDIQHECASARAFVPADWATVADHFLNHPILPGTVLVELGSQVAGVLTEEVFQSTHGTEGWAFLGAIRNVTFLSPVALPATIRIEARCTAKLDAAMTVRIEGFSEEVSVFRGEVIMVTKGTRPEWSEAIEERRQRLSRWRRAL
jgi:3-hydroxymyristoyl/3-hydroxydecanoyl-(acyl carrier protein) dehydratase